MNGTAGLGSLLADKISPLNGEADAPPPREAEPALSAEPAAAPLVAAPEALGREEESALEAEPDPSSATAIAGAPREQLYGMVVNGPAIIGKLYMMEAVGLSDPGCVRPNNEDYFALVRDHGLYVVADGMGGAQAGEHASRLAVETVVDVLLNAPEQGPEALAHAFEEANRRVMSAAADDAMLEGMGTTLVAALEAGPELLIASVGDSRAYVYDGSTLTVITEDQTWVQEVGRRLGIDEESLRTHPMRHVLTMAIGVSAQLRVHSYALRPEPGTQVLLCSDGLHGVVPAEVIAQQLQADGDLTTRCQALIQAARDAGGPDNITVVLMQTRPDTRLAA
jgi:protein phosphatase